VVGYTKVTRKGGW